MEEQKAYGFDAYDNREISWLKFNSRVLSEARDKTLPLFERLKFLSITSSNLDEFFMVRVASLKDQIHAKYNKVDIAGMTPKEQLKEVNIRVHDLVRDQYNTLNRSLMPGLDKIGFKIVKNHKALSPTECEYIDHYFQENVYPVLTPMAMDSSRPFPLIRNKTLNIGALIAKKDRKKDKKVIAFATVQVPSVLSRIVKIPTDNKNQEKFILLEEIISRNLGKLFLSHDVLCSSTYRIMRNADLSIDEDEASDLLVEIETKLKKRQWGEVIRLEVNDEINRELLEILQKEFHVKKDDTYYLNGPLDLTFLMKLYGLKGFGEYKYLPHKPAPVVEFSKDKNIFDVIKERDIFLHHPYVSFDPVVDFIKKAAVDEKVLAIKQTLYRVSGNSPIVAALALAAENGKQVTVLVELKARFDEENNIVWAKKLEKAGVHVIYGLVGLKTHSKITLIIRKEDTGIVRYVHLATGNYNDSTAKLYTDCGIFTTDRKIGEDATAVFNMLSGYSEPSKWYKLIVAPLWMKNSFLRLIKRETENAKKGLPARIIGKMNSLCDKTIIAALYDASRAGVKVDLIIRGICCLKVGINGVSENITVRSIIGNYLEHSRIFYFFNNGQEEYYMGSADWMPRNLDRRVEIVFPVESIYIQKELKHILDLELSDNIKAHVLHNDGTYKKESRRGKQSINSQKILEEEADEKYNNSLDENNKSKRVFIPSESLDEKI